MSGLCAGDARVCGSSCSRSCKWCLLVVDVQYDFCEDGSLPVPAASEIIPVVNSIRSGAPWDLIVLTQDWHPPKHVSFWSTHVATNSSIKMYETITLQNGVKQVMWPDHCVQGSRGAALHEGLITKPADVRVFKGTDQRIDSYSAFFDNARQKQTNLHALLQQKGIDTIFIVGLALDYCVFYSAMDAFSLGLKTYVITDATKGVTDAGSKEALSTLRQNGVNLITSHDVLTMHSDPNSSHSKQSSQSFACSHS